jgi:hypothetical protein
MPRFSAEFTSIAVICFGAVVAGAAAAPGGVTQGEGVGAPGLVHGLRRALVLVPTWAVQLTVAVCAEELSTSAALRAYQSRLAKLPSTNQIESITNHQQRPANRGKLPHI